MKTLWTLANFHLCTWAQKSSSPTILSQTITKGCRTAQNHAPHPCLSSRCPCSSDHGTYCPGENIWGHGGTESGVPDVAPNTPGTFPLLPPILPVNVCSHVLRLVIPLALKVSQTSWGQSFPTAPEVQIVCLAAMSGMPCPLHWIITDCTHTSLHAGTKMPSTA